MYIIHFWVYWIKCINILLQLFFSISNVFFFWNALWCSITLWWTMKDVYKSFHHHSIQTWHIWNERKKKSVSNSIPITTFVIVQWSWNLKWLFWGPRFHFEPKLIDFDIVYLLNICIQWFKWTATGLMKNEKFKFKFTKKLNSALSLNEALTQHTHTQHMKTNDWTNWCLF